MHLISSLVRFSKRFAKQERGSVLILFGLAVLFLVGIGGAAIDLGRQQMMSVRLQNAADAAAVSAATLTNNGKPLTNAEQIGAARRYFTLNTLPLIQGGAQPQATIALAGDVITITSIDDTSTQTQTSFVGNLGVPLLKSAGASKVQANAAISSDYDVVMVVDESGSERVADAGGGQTRIAAQQAALRTMVNSILPTGTTNPNVRVGIVGFSGQITNRWGPSSNNGDVQAAINQLRYVNQNFDHVGLMAGGNMITGGTAGTSNARIGGNAGSFDDTVNANMATPPPRTSRTNPSDANGMSPQKYVIFLSDGGIMIEPHDTPGYSDYGTQNYDKTGLIHQAAGCAGRRGWSSGAAPCYQAFTNACNAVKNMGGADNVHVIFINFVQADPGAVNTAIDCASRTLPGGADYCNGASTCAAKPNANKDYFRAPDTATLNKILTNVTTQIQSVRIVQ